MPHPAGPPDTGASATASPAACPAACPGAGGPDDAAAFVPESLRRPPRVFPAAPRVIYRTARQTLTHDGRIGRIDRAETLAAFRDFSDAFQAWRPQPGRELRALLHNHGFLPDKAALYGLPNPQMDAYLSDFMTRVLPLANGRCAVALGNRQLFWQLYRRLLPLAPLAGLVLGGRRIALPALPAAEAGGRVLARPLLTGDPADGPFWLTDAAGAPTDRGDLLLLAWPGRPTAPPADTAAPERGGTAGAILRLALVHDHRAQRPEVLGGVLLPGDPLALDRPGAVLTARPFDPVTGLAGPGLTFRRDVASLPEPHPDLAAPCLLAGWWPLLDRIRQALLRLPIGVVLQLDILLAPQGPVVVDATDRLDAAALQLQGPLMAGETATAFLREFGL